MIRTTLTLTLFALAIAPVLVTRPALALDVDLTQIGTDAPEWLAQLTERNDG